MTSGRKDIQIKRTTADKLLVGLQQRIIEANRNRCFLFRIKRAVVFGSYVNEPDRDRVGDLDIGIEWEPKVPLNSDRMHRKQKEYPGSDWLSAMNWPKEEVVRFLRNRSAYISIHDFAIDSEAILSKEIIELDVVPSKKRRDSVHETS